MIDDFRDMLRALVAAEVRFLVVDAHALGVHGVPRATGDLDIWVQRSPGNASRLIAGLADFGAPVVDLGIRAEDFVQPDIVAQLGLPPYRIDLLTSISGVQFEDAWAGRVEAEIEGVRVPVLKHGGARADQARDRPKEGPGGSGCAGRGITVPRSRHRPSCPHTPFT